MEERSVGTTEPLGEGLSLSADDVRDLEEGMKRILNAEDHLSRLCAVLTGQDSAQPLAGAWPMEESAELRDHGTAIREASDDAREALAISMKPSLDVRTILGVQDDTPTGELFLEVNNTSGWPATDVRLEVRHRDGRVDTDSRERMNPDRHSNHAGLSSFMT